MSHRLKILGLVLLFAPLAGAFTACATTGAAGSGKAEKQKAGLAASGQEGEEITADALSDAVRVERFDVNRDKKPDIWKYYSAWEGNEYLSRKELDLNSDGRVDIIRTYSSDGLILKEILDMDFDGRFDSTVIYKGGRLLRKEMDLDYDGKIDLWKHYVNDKLTQIDIDKNHDGLPDYWEYYENEQLDRVVYDSDNDGKPDRIERRTIAEEKPAETPPQEDEAEDSSDEEAEDSE